MKNRSENHALLTERLTTISLRQFLLLVVIAVFLVVTYSALADSVDWEYKVVILQGVTAGGVIKKNAAGIHVDVRRTQDLNSLAAEGWEVVAVSGAVATDHTVYLRREIRK